MLQRKLQYHQSPAWAGRQADLSKGNSDLQRHRLRAVAKHGSKHDILVIGSGGREHSLAWKLAQSPLAHQIYCAPGNAGIAEEKGVVGVNSLDTSSSEDVVKWCQNNGIDLVAVGPEVPLVAGLADALRHADIRVIGPSQQAAQLEGSKSFLKGLCERHGIPTAAYKTFMDANSAKEYIRAQGAPIVVKANGLAAGKGVIVAQSLQEAEAAVDDLLVDRKFGSAGEEIVVEEFLDGEEISYFALIDGETCLPLASAQDHKAVGEGDTGPNTGGMGAYSPAPALTKEIEKQVIEEIVQRTASAMVAEGTPFQGILFAGLMVKDGKVFMATASGDLKDVQLQWSADSALCVVMAAEGYPGSYVKNTLIKGLETVIGAKVFHSGTGRNEAGALVSTGGRVLTITSKGKTIEAAQSAAYQAVDQIEWPQGFCRRDIGWRAISR